MTHYTIFIVHIATTRFERLPKFYISDNISEYLQIRTSYILKYAKMLSDIAEIC